MCGLAGEISFRDRPNVNAVEKMLSTLSSRGPDDEGLYVQGNVCLGHRRLKIIDLSNHANQPMVDATLGLTIIFNGCIYNYKSFIGKLESLGYHFFSRSDTEVVLKAYAHWREDCLEQFNGMFAFVIYDHMREDVFVARDRLGVKPLYYFNHSERFCFASTLPALLKHPNCERELDPVSLNYYLSFRAVTQHKTPFKSIKKLAPGHWMKVAANGEIKRQQYWSLQNRLSHSQYPENKGREQFVDYSEKDWTDRLHQALLKSVERRLEADVPVGVLLSGGLDSSLIVGLLHELGQKDIHTFSIGFDAVAQDQGDEFEYSDLIANKFNTTHFKIFAKPHTLLNSLSSCVEAMSEPMVSHDVIGFYLLSKKVSEHVKVVQSGQGADEVFAGYHWYPPMVEASQENAAQAYANAYFSYQHHELKELLHPDWVEEDHALNMVSQYFSQGFHKNPDSSAIEQTLMLDTEVMLVDDPVKRVDNMTMAFGIEARVPFLDHELVEMANQIPYQLKLKGGGKYLLKQVARRIIPHEVIDRPKDYFPVPGLQNMQGPYLEMAKEVFSQREAQQRGIFNMGRIQQMLNQPNDFKGRFGSKLWQATLLELWLQLQLKPA
ncbi:N-acetylglutaminylglutamine amidotransferase [Alteromonas pelagimontana]|uniref:asparagine synthase (glutamine-hydrolyzing) n=1 Tax=Alteromonas pelagimontana TaxID=1858656 RepID=A0A6M4M9X0_9ALTE|nr:N-acetylglutaminylglutamine amidotransferase [Alteromonas pelagimontana]QJR79954.1 N-acetylglutaminylglutamine amidotransferase [Alteromonas pelagimontana]